MDCPALSIGYPLFSAAIGGIRKRVRVANLRFGLKPGVARHPRLPLPRGVVAVRGGAIAVRMLRAGVEGRVTVVVSQVPRRTRLDEFSAPRAIHKTGSDQRCPRLASASVTRQVVLPTPQPLARLCVHRVSTPPVMSHAPHLMRARVHPRASRPEDRQCPLRHGRPPADALTVAGFSLSDRTRGHDVAVHERFLSLLTDGGR